MLIERFIPINGSTYHIRIIGIGEPVLLLHGFTGSGHTWDELMETYKDMYRFIAVDLLGHGKTSAPNCHERYRMEEAADDLRAILDDLGLTRVHVLGYSMGGRLALGFAVRFPEYVMSLTLESSSPGLPSAIEQEDRRKKDAALAARIAEIGVERFADEWSQIPLFATQETLPKEIKDRVREERVSQRAAGLAGSLLGMGTGSQPSYWGELARLQMPVQLLAGELDSKFVRIAKQMAEALPFPQISIIEGAGHAIHVEKPAEFGRIVVDYLKRRKYDGD
ncbi:2-succinyl-6-hydroxy-2,4-cyclohexadiene-1-carboxylate synthase [Gracilibacillus sp. Marseille-QA3620]